MFKRIFAVLLLLLAVSASSTTAASDYDVVFTQVLHRHGARNPDVRTDRGFLCGYDYPCGALTGVGRQMMESLGSYLRTRYNDETIVDAAFFPSTSYNVSLIYSRSTAATRNLQSAESVLMKLFPDTTTFNPAIQTVNQSLDLFLNAESLPRAFTRISVDMTLQEETLAPVVSQYFTLAQLQTLAAEAHADAECASSTGTYHCAWALYDIAMAFQSAGRLSETPQLSAALPNLALINQAAQRWVFGFDRTNAADVVQGTMAQPFVQELVKSMNDYTSGASTLRMKHYTAKDSEVESVLVAMGDQSDTTFNPPYGVAVLVELLKRKADGSYSVQVKRVVPSSPVPAADGSFTYVEQAPQIMCMDATSSPSAAANNICPLADFARYIDSTRPSETNGWCVLPSDEFSTLDCPVTGGAPTNRHCALYRTLCPGHACMDGYVLDGVTYGCVRMTSGSCDEYKVIFTQIVHRHGARSPIVTENTTEICGYEYPCGYLNQYGQEMLFAVGEWMRSRYNDVSIVDEPFFPSTKYNATLVYTRSTGMERTIQSAASLLSALFPDEKAFYPVVFSHNMTIDFLLNTDPMPPVMLKRHYDNDYLAELLNPVVDATIGWDKLQVMAEEGFLSGSCEDYAMRWNCAMNLYDVGTSFEAQRKLGDKPTLAAGIPDLTRINAIYYEFVMTYNASVPLIREQGAMAQNLAQELISNIHAHLLSPSYKMYEYSTHDSMVTPLGVTLGDQSYQTFAPQYGATYIVELLQRGDMTYFIRVLRGEPKWNETADEYQFEETGFVQHCIDNQGEVYLAEDNICPLEDFIRMVDYSKPAVQNGYCIVNQTLYDRMQCPETVTSGGYLSADCEIFRIACPANSCPDGYILNAADYQCYPISGTVPTTGPTQSPSPSPSPTPSATPTASPTPGPTQTPAPSTPPNVQQPANPVARPPARIAQRRRVARQLALGVTTGVVIGAAATQ